MRKYILLIVLLNSIKIYFFSKLELLLVTRVTNLFGLEIQKFLFKKMKIAKPLLYMMSTQN